MMLITDPISGPRNDAVLNTPDVGDGRAGGIAGERLFQADEKTRTSVPVSRDNPCVLANPD
jgi:hypothetical protein